MPRVGLKAAIPRWITIRIPASDHKATEVGIILNENYDAPYSVIFSVTFSFNYVYRNPPFRNDAQFTFTINLVIFIHSYRLTIIKGHLAII